MGRYPRLSYPGLIYHVINRGNNRDIVFVEDEDFVHYINTIQRYKKKYQFKLFAYCLMTNHIHLLIKTSEKANISKIMQSITVAHTRHYHYKYRRCGHVWQGRFFSPIVSEDGHVLSVMRYIEQNPMRAKMVREIGDYAWSSYKLNIRYKESELIDREENSVFQGLGCDDMARIGEYKKLMKKSLEEKQLKEIRFTTFKEKNYISEKFEKQILELLPRRRKIGRPKKKSN